VDAHNFNFVLKFFQNLGFLVEHFFVRKSSDLLKFRGTVPLPPCHDAAA